MRTTIIERCEKMLCNLDEYQQKGKFELFIDGGDLMDLEEDILLTSGKKATLYPLYEFLDGVNNLYEQKDWHNAYEKAQAIAQRDCFFMDSADWADTLTGLEYPETLTDEGKQYLKSFGDWLYSQVKQLRRKYEQPSVGGME